jgi:erythromycin esterase-like protein
MTMKPENKMVEQASPAEKMAAVLRADLEPFEDVHNPDLDLLMKRIDNSRVVLLGESTHGTAEFYNLRAAITRRLIEEKGFNLVAFEADWPDMERVNDYIHGRADAWSGFDRFPEWMWRNLQFGKLTRDLRKHNENHDNLPVSVFGLDLYSLASSLKSVVEFLQKTDPEAAQSALKAQSCLHPWQFDPSRYGLSVWRENLEGCREQVLELLRTMHEEQISDSTSPRELLSALQNARITANAEEYYRVMYESSVESWNLRDGHMFETLLLLLDHYGPQSKVIIWEHNSHLGNAAATQMGRIGEINVGQLCRSKFGDDCYSIGFMTDTGTVAAASQWDGEMEIKSLRPARKDSYEHILHEAGKELGENAAYFLPIRKGSDEVKEALSETKLERAVGVIYLPETERQSHYFHATLSDQFDEICWVDKTHAVTPMEHVPETSAPDMVPFGI